MAYTDTPDYGLLCYIDVSFFLLYVHVMYIVDMYLLYVHVTNIIALYNHDDNHRPMLF